VSCAAYGSTSGGSGEGIEGDVPSRPVHRSALSRSAADGWGANRACESPRRALFTVYDATLHASVRPGGALKPCFGLSGAVRQVDRVSLPLARVFLPPTRTQSLFVLPILLRTDEDGSAPNLPDEIGSQNPRPFGSAQGGLCRGKRDKDGAPSES